MSSENVKTVEQVEQELLKGWESMKTALTDAEHELFEFVRGVKSAGPTARKSMRAMKATLASLTALTLECDKVRKAARAAKKSSAPQE